MAELTTPIQADITVVQQDRWIRRRKEPRYQCGPTTTSKVVEEECETPRQAWVRNISTSGVGLLYGQPVEPGDGLLVQLRVAGMNKSFELRARVIHCTRQISGDYLLGCAFENQLTADDL